ncbi:hypothetical protein GHO42_20250 [Pseudomonas sp. FSL R10-0056]|jgi:hypothetical protein|uniref:Uncharacterized protein n=2 Tax=Pseudomonas TaxID=286 RepID=A0AB39WQZ7_9PSED|nr:MULTISPECIES: hypothetical protein [Pseudomonas]KOX66739.1 hypothetical protein AA303_02215 [Pseudomonas psychrophila]MBW0236621.1 hypothetical protein [Pseudomonas sp. D1HM]MQT65392.1 hypothetical protein [Pseudomonas sp. FSL R10-0056]MQT70881.1 hypothetical protein [Pseudomonas sp. FSL R10-0071]MQU50530.1 hypothetical protein [Pseudomonas sp. FSL A6-1183]
MSKSRPFIDTLRDIEAGGLLDELSETQHSLIDAIRLTGKGGELTIKLAYKPDGNGQMTIKADVKAKEPALSRGTSLFFLTPEGNLTRRDPRQQDLPLRTVNDDKPEVLRQVSQ